MALLYLVWLGMKICSPLLELAPVASSKLPEKLTPSRQDIYQGMITSTWLFQVPFQNRYLEMLYIYICEHTVHCKRLKTTRHWRSVSETS